MSNVFTLESLKEETKRKFDPFKLKLSDGTEVTLSSALRLGKDNRKVVSKALEEVSTLQDEEDTPEALESLVEAISRIFTAVCDKPQKLLSDLHEDDLDIKVALMSRILAAWAKETQLGEA